MMPRFHIADIIPPVEGQAHAARWNGWCCPYFERASVDAIVAAHCAYYSNETTAKGQPFAYVDERTRVAFFWSPDAGEWDEFPARVADGAEVWDIGAWGWCWETEADELTM